MISINCSAGPIRILAAEKGWLAVDKPVGLTIHNDPGKDLCSLFKAEMERHPSLAERIGSEGEERLHPVHRLDRMTSGVVLLADRRMLSVFSQQFTGGKVKKKYLAIVHGSLLMDGENERGRWTRPLTKSAGGRKSPEGRGKRIACETRFQVLQNTPHYTLLECELITGRKHQIRRHAKLAGHAVAGDERYGTPRSVKFLKDRCGFRRLGLHALSLEIHDPGNHRSRLISTGAMPPEMQRLLDDDRA